MVIRQLSAAASGMGSRDRKRRRDVKLRKVPRCFAFAAIISSATAAVRADFGKTSTELTSALDYLEGKGKFSSSADLSAWKKVLVDQQYTTAQMYLSCCAVTVF